ncbi:hypothetical protein BC829DRAFT_251033 [Chytridium lagenaria]|nr:hypothetical protein BC829DRAFT_251033 [Chytridium lagenaria]
MHQRKEASGGNHKNMAAATAASSQSSEHPSLVAHLYLLIIHLLSAFLHLFLSIHTLISSWTLSHLSTLGTSFFVVRSEVRNILFGPADHLPPQTVSSITNSNITSKNDAKKTPKRLSHVAIVLKPELVEASSHTAWPTSLFMRSLVGQSGVLEEKPRDLDSVTVAKLTEDVAKMACWCLASGVDYLSVYDRLGYIKRHHNELLSQLSQAFAEFSKSEPNVAVSTPSSNTPLPSTLTVYTISIVGKDDIISPFKFHQRLLPLFQKKTRNGKLWVLFPVPRQWVKTIRRL